MIPGDHARPGLRKDAPSPGEAWVPLNIGPSIPAGSWARLVFDVNVFFPLIRPVLRFTGDFGVTDMLTSAPLFGRSEWIGMIPAGTKAIAVDVGSDGEVDGIRLQRLEQLGPVQVLWQAFRRNPHKTAIHFAALLRGLRVEATEELAAALNGTPLAEYDSWRRARDRGFERDGLDRPLAAASSALRIHLIVDATSVTPAEIRRLFSMLQQQSHEAWSLGIVGSPNGAIDDLGADPRLFQFEDREAISKFLANADPLGLIGLLRAGDLLCDGALAVLADHAQRQTQDIVVYADEDCYDAGGRFHSPRLKPDWSPEFHRHANYTGAAVFARAHHVRAVAEADPIDALLRRDWIAEAPQGCAVGHVRRVLLSRLQPEMPRATARSHPRASPRAEAGATPSVSIIIPTRDRLDLLRVCIEGIRAHSAGSAVEVLVVDNDSCEAATLAYLRDLAQMPGFVVLRRPGPFNFSALCNAGAEVASGDCLIFLNNDTEVRTSGWVERLSSLAALPGVGAVGARLLFPSGPIQHAGVVIGLGGRAGHIELRAPADSAGYLERLQHVHEVSAVTGACLAVGRASFVAVGGFDEHNLPVDLNDIDLCLRLRQTGLRNLLVPDCVLIHHESRTRGRAPQPSRLYAKERRWFVERWSDVIRDDPYFHPALSLHSLTCALG